MFDGATLPAVDWDLQGRHAKEHLNLAVKYADKAKQNRTSALYIIRQAKAQLPRGKFDPWLEKHEIARSTAYRLMLEEAAPERREERRDYQSQRNEEAKDMRRANRPVHETDREEQLQPERAEETAAQQAAEKQRREENNRNQGNHSRAYNLLGSCSRFIAEGDYNTEAIAQRIVTILEGQRTVDLKFPGSYQRHLNAARMLVGIGQKLKPLLPTD
jgi:hypothetical protein